MTAAWYSDGQGSVGSEGTEDWSNFDDPQVDQLFAQAAEALNPVTGGAIYAQIDDQLWDQMVALPLFAEPGFEANGGAVGQRRVQPLDRRPPLECGPVDHAQARSRRPSSPRDPGQHGPSHLAGCQNRPVPRYHASRPGSDTGRHFVGVAE